MIERINLLIEALTICTCLHYLYGKKFKLDIATVSLLAIDMIMMQTIDYYKWSSMLSVLFYPIIFIYCGIEFGFKIRELLINNILYMIIVGGTQLTVGLLYGYTFNVHILTGIRLVVINVITYGIITLINHFFVLKRLSIYLQDKERLLNIALFISVLILAYCLLNYKNTYSIDLGAASLLFLCVAFIFVLGFQLSKYKIKTKEIETELKINKLYANSFQNLIDSIRIKQHEFDNHINTIYNQHYMCNTYEELVNAQKNYCETVIKDNQFNKLLVKGNPVIIGFLYGKFVEISKQNINIVYEVNIDELDVGIPTFKLVELVGNILNNAVEALKIQKEIGNLYLSIIEINKEFEIEIRNESKYIDYTEITSFFTKGYSQKGADRGLGLYNVKNICEEYQLSIICENKKIDNQNWLSFVITNKKNRLNKQT